MHCPIALFRAVEGELGKLQEVVAASHAGALGMLQRYAEREGPRSEQIEASLQRLELEALGLEDENRRLRTSLAEAAAERERPLSGDAAAGIGKLVASPRGIAHPRERPRAVLEERWTRAPACLADGCPPDSDPCPSFDDDEDLHFFVSPGRRLVLLDAPEPPALTDSASLWPRRRPASPLPQRPWGSPRPNPLVPEASPSPLPPAADAPGGPPPVDMFRRRLTAPSAPTGRPSSANSNSAARAAAKSVGFRFSLAAGAPGPVLRAQDEDVDSANERADASLLRSPGSVPPAILPASALPSRPPASPVQKPLPSDSTSNAPKLPGAAVTLAVPALLTRLESPGESVAESSMPPTPPPRGSLQRMAVLDCWKIKEKNAWTSPMGGWHAVPWQLEGKKNSLPKSETFRLSEKAIKVIGEEHGDEDDERDDGSCGCCCGCCARCTIRNYKVPFHPNSLIRASWDMLSLFFVVYDFLFMPLMFLSPPETGFSRSMSWTTRLFWSGDILMTCMTGVFQPDGFVEMRSKQNLKRYAKTWLLFDSTFVCMDWIEVVVLASLDGAGASEGLGVASMGRMLRLLRLMRLLRVVRALSVVMLFTERIYSEKLLIVMDIMKIVAVLFSLAHLMACCWYGIGRGEAPSWLAHYEYGPQNLVKGYAMAFHWSLASFTGGMDEVVPQNLSERTFTIGAILFGTIISASLVSALTTSLTKLTILTSSRTSAFSSLRRYLSEHRISPDLRLRIQRNAKHVFIDRQRHISETQVDMLRDVSEPLLVELHFELYAPTFSTHPFFKRYCVESPVAMRKVCHECVSLKVFHPGDVIFTRGEIPSPPAMLFLIAGMLEYEGMDGRYDVEAGQWACEGALWTCWMHLGTLRSTWNSRILLLDAAGFQRIVGRALCQDLSPKDYAQRIVQAMSEDPILSDIGDRQECDEIIRELVGDEEGESWSRASTAGRRSIGGIGGKVRSVGGIGGMGVPRKTTSTTSDCGAFHIPPSPGSVGSG